VQLTCATVEVALITPLIGAAPTWPGIGASVSLVVLGAVGTGVAYILNLTVIRAAGSTIASTVTYVTPLWSTLLGAVLLVEPIGWNTIAGGIVVIAGVLFTRAARRQDTLAVPAMGPGDSSRTAATQGRVD
jgi:drug/metabolite transporter (DMT)-like permease